MKHVCFSIARYTYDPNEAYFTNCISLLDKHCAKYYPTLNMFNGILELIVYQFVGGVQWNNNFIDEIEQYDNFKQKQFHFQSVQESIELATFYTPDKDKNKQKHSTNIGLDDELDTDSKIDNLNANNNNNHNNIYTDKIQIGIFSQKIEEYILKYPFVSKTDAMYYIIYDECNNMSEKEKKKFIKQHRNKMKSNKKPSISNNSQFGQNLSCIISPVDGYEWKLHKQSIMSRLKSQLKAIKHKAKSQSITNINNNNSNDSSDDSTDEEDDILLPVDDVDINDYDIGFSDELKLSDKLSNVEILNLSKMAESKLYEINCKWIKLDWFYNEYLKEQLMFNKNCTMVLFKNNKQNFQFINLKTYLPILNDCKMMINCYLLGYAIEAWVGIMNKRDYQQQRSIKNVEDAITCDNCNSNSKNEWYQPSNRLSFGVYDCISFYINTSKIVGQQCCKVFKNGQLVYNSKKLPYKSLDPFDYSQIYLVGVVDSQSRAIIVEQVMLS